MGDGCGEAGNSLGDTHTHRGREAVNCYETSLLGEHLWDAGGSKSGKCDCSSIKAQNGGGALTKNRWVRGVSLIRCSSAVGALLILASVATSVFRYRSRSCCDTIVSWPNTEVFC